MTDANAPRHHDIVMPALLRHARTTYGGAMRRALDELADYAQEVKVLGSYPVAIA